MNERVECGDYVTWRGESGQVRAVVRGPVAFVDFKSGEVVPVALPEIEVTARIDKSGTAMTPDQMRDESLRAFTRQAGIG